MAMWCMEGNELLNTLRYEIAEEFPSIDDTPEVLLLRHYDYDFDDFWKADPGTFEEFEEE